MSADEGAGPPSGEGDPAGNVGVPPRFALDATGSGRVGLSSLRAELSDLLGAPADLVERGALRPGVREAAEREAVRAW